MSGNCHVARLEPDVYPNHRHFDISEHGHYTFCLQSTPGWLYRHGVLSRSFAMPLLHEGSNRAHNRIYSLLILRTIGEIRKFRNKRGTRRLQHAVVVHEDREEETLNGTHRSLPIAFKLGEAGHGYMMGSNYGNSIDVRPLVHVATSHPVTPPRAMDAFMRSPGIIL